MPISHSTVSYSTGHDMMSLQVNNHQLTGVNMGRINATVKIKNIFEPASNITCDALVDTGAANMVLPIAWKERLGNLTTIRKVD